MHGDGSGTNWRYWSLLTSAIAVVVALVMVVTTQVTAGPMIGDHPVGFGPEGASPDARTLAIRQAEPGERWIMVDRTLKTVTLFVGQEPQATYPARLGYDPSPDGFFATAIGTYRVHSKTEELTPTSFYEGGYLTDWVGFDPDRFNGFHSEIRDARGNPLPAQGETTQGCVRLAEPDAQAVYDFATLGMRVEILD